MSEKEKKHWVKLPVKVTVVPPKVSTNFIHTSRLFQILETWGDA